MRETGWRTIFRKLVKILDVVRIGGETWMDRAPCGGTTLSRMGGVRPVKRWMYGEA